MFSLQYSKVVRMIHINSWRFKSEKLHDFFILGFIAEEFKEIFMSFPVLQVRNLIKYLTLKCQ